MSTDGQGVSRARECHFELFVRLAGIGMVDDVGGEFLQRDGQAEQAPLIHALFAPKGLVGLIRPSIIRLLDGRSNARPDSMAKPAAPLAPRREQP